MPGSPLLDDFNQTGMITPPLRKAFDLAQGQMMPPLTSMQPPYAASARPGPDPGAAPPAVVPPMGGQPAVTPPPAAGAMVASPNPSMAAHQAELQRLTAPPRAHGDPLAHTRQDTGLAGEDQIHNPWVRTPLKILDAIGSTFLPALTAGIPGTQIHHNLLQRSAASNVQRDQTQLNDEQKRGLEAAQTTNQAAQPELKQGELERKQLADELKNTRETTRIQNDAASKKSGADAARRKLGEKWNPDTQSYEPIGEEDMTITEKNVHDLRNAQTELANANTEFKKAQATNQPTMVALAQKRVENAANAHSTAQQRLGLSERQTEARLHGTEGGVALPGAMMNEAGNPVGSTFQQNVRPTGSERNKGDMAQSAHEQLGTLKDIVKRRPDIFGPAAGRKTDFDMWLGSQDPDAQRFAAARTIAADHLAGTFGGRSEAALHALDNAIGQFKTNPEAVSAGLDQLEKGNEVFRKAGTVHTAPGGSSPKSGPSVGTVENGYRFKGGNPAEQGSWEKVK